MQKRIIAAFTVFCLLIGCTCLRLYVVCTKGTEYVSGLNHHFSVEISKLRGEITDCKSRKLTDIDYNNFVVAKPTAKALSEIEKTVDEDLLSDLKERMEKGNAVAFGIGKNEISENSDVKQIKVYKRYNGLAQHILGYVNSDSDGVTGLEQAFNTQLKTGKTLTARMIVGANGSVLNGTEIEILNNYTPASSVQLTVDRDIQQTAENALDKFGVEQGGAVVIDSATGAIRAMASRPNYNGDSVSEYLTDETQPLVNRCLQAYAVGSVFKVAVCMSAIENGIDDFQYNCVGHCKVDGISFNCFNSKVHGELDMQKALECSCNCYFIELAKKIGSVNLLSTVKLLGFGQEIKLADGMLSQSGTIPSEDKLKLSGELANFSFGQGTFTASMLQIAQMIMTVANGGKYITPYLVEKAFSENGEQTFAHKPTYPIVVSSKYTADRLTQMLTGVVERGNAVGAKPDKKTAAGKTATAQTGTFYKNGVEICNTWFGGFFPAESPKYIVVILKQGGNSGAEDCAPVFKYIADNID